MAVKCVRCADDSLFQVAEPVGGFRTYACPTHIGGEVERWIKLWRHRAGQTIWVTEVKYMLVTKMIARITIKELTS